MVTVKDITKAMENISHRHDLYRVWCDFNLFAATSLANAVDKRPDTWQQREVAYLQAAKAYTRDELNEFARVLALVVEAMDSEMPGDLLGQAYMQMELGNKWAGQFFTPDSLCQVMAGLTIDAEELNRKIQHRGFFTVSEPSVGGGATIIALANQLRAAKVNYQQHMHVTAVDVDIKSVHMAYIQFSLLNIPAVIIHGNTLTLEEWSHWYTPAHILGGWNYKLQRRNDDPAVPAPTPSLIDFDNVEQVTMF